MSLLQRPPPRGCDVDWSRHRTASCGLRKVSQRRGEFLDALLNSFTISEDHRIQSRLRYHLAFSSGCAAYPRLGVMNRQIDRGKSTLLTLVELLLAQKGRRKSVLLSNGGDAARGEASATDISRGEIGKDFMNNLRGNTRKKSGISRTAGVVIFDQKR